MIITDIPNLKYKISLFVFLFGLLINAGHIHSQSLSYYEDGLECEYLAKDAEEKYELPKNILLSISRVESGYQKVDGIVRAWPWALNAGGESSYFKSKKAALASLEKRIKSGVTNIDVGCMQLNYRWHHKFFSTLSEMISPRKNVDYGARFLKKLYHRHGSWEKAIKYYHSSKSKFNVNYYKKVKAVWKRENNESSFKTTLVAASLKPETKKENILRKKEKTLPLVNLSQNNQDPYAEHTIENRLYAQENSPTLVSAVNFHKMADADTEFDFTSFVKSVSRKNTSVPKYIRDNWTIVLSIRNQLENND